MMFGSYPYPGNIIENDTIEFINVYVKPGKPPKFNSGRQGCTTRPAEWLDLAQQVWFMYPPGRGSAGAIIGAVSREACGAPDAPLYLRRGR